MNYNRKMKIFEDWKKKGADDNRIEAGLVTRGMGLLRDSMPLRPEQQNDPLLIE